jgi:hypothetical protein
MVSCLSSPLQFSWQLSASWFRSCKRTFESQLRLLVDSFVVSNTVVTRQSYQLQTQCMIPEYAIRNEMDELIAKNGGHFQQCL